MTSVPGELRLGDATVGQTTGLPRAAWLYFGAVVAATLGAAFPLAPRIHADGGAWTGFLVLSACAAVAQLFVVRTIRDQSYHTSTAFLIAGALVLPPELVLLMGVVQHIPEWLKHRYPWYIQTFNISNYTLNGLAAWGAAQLVTSHTRSWVPDSPRAAVAGLAACVVFVGLNHVLMAGMLFLARGHRPKETGLFSGAMLSTEFVLASLGIGVAVFWRVNPSLIPFAVAPLLLIHRALHVPRLEEQARMDPKTGLFNARHFSTVLTDELARAQRFDRPASLIMADLDLLRDINNTYGHLVGDEVLAGVADVFRDELRDYDVPARFGGEEFAILLPETSYEQALDIAERVRKAVADRIFDFEDAREPVSVTISMGVASFPEDGVTPNELVHRADLAGYRAKLQGRNRVQGARSEPLLVPVDRAPRLVALPPVDAVETPRERRHRHVRVGVERRRTARPDREGWRRLVQRFRSDRPTHDRTPATRLRAAAETIRAQNVLLSEANQLLRERSTAAMESLSATIDARDAYTAGHARRVQRIALAIGRELDFSQTELDLLGHAALFHDIGKLAVPDAILLKPATLDTEEWRLMRRHSEEGARIVDRLGFLADAVPAIRHHHERFDGRGYPDGLSGEDIPLGARIIHVADALDSMLTSRIYRPALSEGEALAELRNGAGSQFCPRCVHALERVVELGESADDPELAAIV